MQDQKYIVPQPLAGDEKALSEEIRAAVFALMDAHELPAHGGRACGMNRIGMVAWLAHSLGVGSAHLSKLMALIASYESGCPCGVPTLTEEAFTFHQGEEGGDHGK